MVEINIFTLTLTYDLVCALLAQYAPKPSWYDESLGGSQSITYNPTLGLCSRTFLHTTVTTARQDCTKSTQTCNKHYHHGDGPLVPLVAWI